jgi:hypothetical protein
MRTLIVATALACALQASPVPAAPRLELTKASFLDIDSNLRRAQGHPNERERYYALKAYKTGRHQEAVERFARAASYADKYSQHYLSLIYWHGAGVERDPVMAYIWSDLAAERGSRPLLAIREKIWSELDDAQRKQVEAEGAAYYDRYGDAVAKPKADAEIRRFARNMTGSRTGYSNQNIDIISGGPISGAFGNPGGNAMNGMMAASAAVNGGMDEKDMYGSDRTSLADYWRGQDKELNAGRVEVGELQQAQEP